jgi:biopolymer transport protein ExbD
LPSQKDLALPKSTAQKVPEDTLVLAITPQSILLQGREVAKVQDLLTATDEVIAPLKQALEAQRDNRQLRRAKTNAEEAITILGDENISYALLHKILATCQQANYTKIAFAAHQLAKPKD